MYVIETLASKVILKWYSTIIYRGTKVNATASLRHPEEMETWVRLLRSPL
jgi:hypothetical protein